MIFKTLEKKEFRFVLEYLLETVQVIGPQEVDRDKNNKPLYTFLPADSIDQIDLDYDKSIYSAKTFFLPFKEELSNYTFTDNDWNQKINYHSIPRAIIGLRACDINALVKLDKVMMKGPIPNPYYITRRKNSLIIGLDHEPLKDCFCRSLNADTVTHGFDLFLSDIGKKYFIAINSDEALNLLNQFNIKDISESDQKRYIDRRKHIISKFKTDVDIRGLGNLLDIEFESPVWKKWGEKCLSCGSCAMVCPTCYCYGVQMRWNINLEKARKVRLSYSCNLLDFAEVAGGHNFRPTSESRLKYRYYHQFRGFVERIWRWRIKNERIYCKKI
jgi:ferredoxin